MSLLASLAKPHTTPATSKINLQPFVAWFWGDGGGQSEYRTRRGKCRNDIRFQVVAHRRRESSLEALFIRSLVTASTCDKHVTRASHVRRESWTRMHRLGVTGPRSSNTSIRPFSSRSGKDCTAAGAALAPRDNEISREEYRELVNTYPKFHPDQLTHEDRAAKRAKHAPLAPRLFLTVEQEDSPPYRPRQILEPETQEHFQLIRKFSKTLQKELGHVSHNRLWRQYENLPSPRLRYLMDKQVSRLFQHLAWTQFKSHPGAMQHYFALVDECLGERIDLHDGIWNTAIAFAGRWMKKVSSLEVKSAVETWMRMEQAGKKATHVTFHILFDVAVKAGRFALADTLYQEMSLRGLPFSRHFRTSIIYYAGMRRDGDGVRQAFKDLVNASDIVDTAVMNCVVQSLIRAGEAPAAEHVFMKMKRLQEQKFGTVGPRDWVGQRRLGNILGVTGFVLRKQRFQHESSFFGATFSSDEKREQIQRQVPIAPNAGTYQILIRHHATTSGNVERIRELVAEMEQAGLPVHGSVYVQIIRGFWVHGGAPHTSWNREALESLWSGFINAFEQGQSSRNLPNLPLRDDYDLLGAMIAEIDQQSGKPSSEDKEHPRHISAEGDDEEAPLHERPPCFNNGLAFAAIRAFYKCVGRARMLEVWDEMIRRWEDMTDDDRAHLQDQVDKFVRDDERHFPL